MYGYIPPVREERGAEGGGVREGTATEGGKDETAKKEEEEGGRGGREASVEWDEEEGGRGKRRDEREKVEAAVT